MSILSNTTYKDSYNIIWIIIQKEHWWACKIWKWIFTNISAMIMMVNLINRFFYHWNYYWAVSLQKKTWDISLKWLLKFLIKIFRNMQIEKLPTQYSQSLHYKVKSFIWKRIETNWVSDCLLLFFFRRLRDMLGKVLLLETSDGFSSAHIHDRFSSILL